MTFVVPAGKPLMEKDVALLIPRPGNTWVADAYVDLDVIDSSFPDNDGHLGL